MKMSLNLGQSNTPDSLKGSGIVCLALVVFCGTLLLSESSLSSQSNKVCSSSDVCLVLCGMLLFIKGEVFSEACLLPCAVLALFEGEMHSEGCLKLCAVSLLGKDADLKSGTDDLRGCRCTYRWHHGQKLAPEQESSTRAGVEQQSSRRAGVEHQSRSGAPEQHQSSTRAAIEQH